MKALILSIFLFNTLAAETIEQSINKGLEFLLSHQNKNGSWGSAKQTKALNIYAPAPGAHRAFRSAVTSLSLRALLHSGKQKSKQFNKGHEWLFENQPKVKRCSVDTLYNIWSHAYAIEFAVDLYKHKNTKKAVKKKLALLIKGQINRLKRYETVNGGWAYYNFGPITPKVSSHPNSFATAAILISLKHAESAGFASDKKIIKRAVKAVKRQQKKDFSYLYSSRFRTYPMLPVNRPAGSLGRTQVCNRALFLYKDSIINKKSTELCLKRFLDRNNWLDIGRKRPVPHESWFSVAGYYYYFGHYYASTNLPLSGKDKQRIYAKKLSSIIISKQEKDGSWWDFPLYNYHKYYGTAFAILTLKNCQ
ncbi:MAG: terpene cyclase/mutase family protein [Lentisphaeria bacterium]|nr:terpene cyclase/mutase family protein [Lentisphaeria bacterium]